MVYQFTIRNSKTTKPLFASLHWECFTMTLFFSRWLEAIWGYKTLFQCFYFWKLFDVNVFYLYLYIYFQFLNSVFLSVNLKLLFCSDLRVSVDFSNIIKSDATSPSSNISAMLWGTFLIQQDRPLILVGERQWSLWSCLWDSCGGIWLESHDL